MALGTAFSLFETMLEGHDPPLIDHLQRLGIKPEYYALRWLTMFFAQEFALPEVLRLWDSLLASPHRVDFVLSIASSMMIYHREALLGMQFEGCLELLQRLGTDTAGKVDIHALITWAMELQLQHLPVNDVRLPPPPPRSVVPRQLSSRWRWMRIGDDRALRCA